MNRESNGLDSVGIRGHLRVQVGVVAKEQTGKKRSPDGCVIVSNGGELCAAIFDIATQKQDLAPSFNLTTRSLLVLEFRNRVQCKWVKKNSLTRGLSRDFLSEIDVDSWLAFAGGDVCM